MRTITSLIIAFLFIIPLAKKNFGQSYRIDESIPEIKLDTSSELTVLNSRMGSRFSLSYASRDNGMHTGALGYDQDEFVELLAAVELGAKKYCFRTAGKPNGYQYLHDQKMTIGMNSMQLRGRIPNKAEVILTVVSPFTPSNSLQDTQNVKTQIVPGYYILFDIRNLSGQPIEGRLKTGISKMMISPENGLGARQWEHGAHQHQIWFRDNASLHTHNVLAAMRYKGQYHFNTRGINGIQSKFSLSTGETQTDTLIYATHYQGEVLHDDRSGSPLRYYYLKYWSNADEVLHYMRTNADKNILMTEKFENLLKRSNASPKEKWVIANAFHSDIANTFLLQDENNEPRFYLAEGRFKHLSTVDVAHETELTALFAPWRLRLQLEQWLNYIAREEVNKGTASYNTPHVEGISASEYGPYIYHDVGDRPRISGSSDYWFGPHMAVEENCNYTLLLYWYWKLTGNDEFVRDKLGMVESLLHSVKNRDTDGNGIVDMGFGWTTYDGAETLKRAPENVYLGIKQLSAYELAADMFEKLKITPSDEGVSYNEAVEGAQDGKEVGFEQFRLPNSKLREKQAETYRRAAGNIAQTLEKAYDEYGYLPVSLDESFENWDAHSVVLGEGLFIPALTGYSSANMKEVAEILGESYEKAFPKSKLGHSIGLTTTAEGSSWFSKVMVSDIVASYWYGIDRSTAHYAYDWNINNYYAYNDGVKPNGKDPWIGFWYPRGVSSLGYLFRERNFTAPERASFTKELQ
jgi:hypothetical protein